MHKLIDIQDLSIYFRSHARREAVVSGLSLGIEKKEILGLYGSSGGGKTLTALSLIGLTPKEADVRATIHYRFDGFVKSTRLPMNPADARQIRRKHIAFVFQQAASGMDPLMRMGKQIAECAPPGLPASAKKRKVLEILRELDFEDPARIWRSFPHQLSIGQQQRAMLAMAMIREPDLIIADEPFAGIDKITEGQLKTLIKRINEKMGTAFLIISHDRKLLEDLAGRLLELKDGQLRSGQKQEAATGEGQKPEHREGKILLQVDRLSKSFAKGGRFAIHRIRMDVLSNLNFYMKEGERLGVMGKSGTGKSTLALLLSGLTEPDRGAIVLDGKEISPRSFNGLGHKPPAPVQVVFQDPYSSFDPAKTIARQFVGGTEAREELKMRMDSIGLAPGLLNRRPYQLSGGQLQRIVFLQTLLLKPRLLICDESFTAIDLDSRERVFELLRTGYRNQSMLILSHIPEVIRQLCDRLIVLKEGKIEEEGPVKRLFRDPRSEWTKFILGRAQPKSR